MKLLDRLKVAATGAAAAAGAGRCRRRYPRGERLLPAGSAGRVPAGAVGRHGPRHQGAVPERRLRTRPGLYLLDGMRAQDDFNGWDINTPAFEWYLKSGISVDHAGRRPVQLLQRLVQAGVRQGGLLHLQVGDLPDQRAAGLPGLASTASSRSRNAAVGLSMAGSSAMTLAIYHPNQFTYAGSLSGYLNPSTGQGLDRPGDGRRRRLQEGTTCGVPTDDPAWLRNDPTVNVDKLVANNTRLWVYCGNGKANELGGDNIPAMFLEQNFMIGAEQEVPGALHRGRRQQRRVQLPGVRHPQLGVLGPAAAGHEARPAGAPGCHAEQRRGARAE